MLGLEFDEYPAYCLDEAVTFFGLTVESMLDQVGHKPSKEERRARAAREAMIEKLFSKSNDDKKTSGFADPAVMFQ